MEKIAEEVTYYSKWMEKYLQKTQVQRARKYLETLQNSFVVNLQTVELFSVVQEIFEEKLAKVIEVLSLLVQSKIIFSPFCDCTVKKKFSSRFFNHTFLMILNELQNERH